MGTLTSPSIAGSLITAAVTLVGITVSASLIFWQAYKQNKNLLKQQEKKIRDELKLTVYLEIEKFLHVATTSLVNAVNDVNAIPSALSSYLFMKDKLGLSPEPIKERRDTLLNGYKQAAIDLTNIVYAIERYEIVLPKIETLRLAFFEKDHECSDKFMAFFNEAIQFIPHDIPEDSQSIIGKTVTMRNATTADIQKLQDLAKAYIKCANDLQAYIYDLRIILQNSLLGHIFDKHLSGRKKANPNLIILKTDDSEDMKKLKSDLLRSSSWGKTLARTYHSSSREDY